MGNRKQKDANFTALCMSTMVDHIMLVHDDSCTAVVNSNQEVFLLKYDEFNVTKQKNNPTTIEFSWLNIKDTV